MSWWRWGTKNTPTSQPRAKYQRVAQSLSLCRVWFSNSQKNTQKCDNENFLCAFRRVSVVISLTFSPIIGPVEQPNNERRFQSQGETTTFGGRPTCNRLLQLLIRQHTKKRLMESEKRWKNFPLPMDASLSMHVMSSAPKKQQRNCFFFCRTFITHIVSLELKSWELLSFGVRSYVMRRLTSHWSLLLPCSLFFLVSPQSRAYNNYRLVWVVRNQLSLFLITLLLQRFFCHYFIQFFDIFCLAWSVYAARRCRRKKKLRLNAKFRLENSDAAESEKNLQLVATSNADSSRLKMCFSSLLRSESEQQQSERMFVKHMVRAREVEEWERTKKIIIKKKRVWLSRQVENDVIMTLWKFVRFSHPSLEENKFIVEIDQSSSVENIEQVEVVFQLFCTLVDSPVIISVDFVCSQVATVKLL